MTLEYTRSDMVWALKGQGQGHTVNNTTQWHFISNYNHASFTFTRWQYQYYMVTTTLHCHLLGGNTDEQYGIGSNSMSTF